MDFRQTTQPASSRPATSAVPQANSAKTAQPKIGGPNNKWLKLLNVVILFSVAILIAAIAFAFTRSTNDNEFKYVNQSKYQAVFLNNGQVYFGSIDSLNNKYVQLSNIYYLTQTTPTTSTDQSSGNYTLVKLGCQQIHDPYDQMLINRDQVTFWENLQDSGKVVSSINSFKKQNPSGPDCSQVSNQTQASSSTTQGDSSTTTGTSGTTSTTGTSSTTTKK